jgi:hypothetical protein
MNKQMSADRHSLFCMQNARAVTICDVALERHYAVIRIIRKQKCLLLYINF